MSVITNSLTMMDTSSTITSLDADAVVYDNTTSGLTATDAQAAIDELDNTIDTISTEISSLGAADVGYTKTIPEEFSIPSVAITNVQEAFDYLLSVDTAHPVPSAIVNYYDSSGLLFYNTTSVEAALRKVDSVLADFLEPTASSWYILPATNVSFTKPQDGIYGSNTDTVQEALEDVSAKVLDLAASDIAYVNGCGGSYPTEVETVHDALECLQHLLLKYSEFEEETGWLWFNDKPIYQISVEVESGTTNLFDTNELKIDDLVYMEATLTNSGGTKRWTISGSSGDFYWNTATHMIVYGGSDIVTTATIRYTKTSD